MKKFNIIFIITLLVIAASFISANLLIHSRSESGRPYRVEIKQLADEITAGKEPEEERPAGSLSWDYGSGPWLFLLRHSVKRYCCLHVACGTCHWNLKSREEGETAGVCNRGDRVRGDKSYGRIGDKYDQSDTPDTDFF